MLERAQAASVVRSCLTYVLVVCCQLSLAQAQQQVGQITDGRHVSILKSGAGGHLPPVAVPQASPAANCPPMFEDSHASEGVWEWRRDPLQERRRTVRIYNVHCVRCHGVSGRGVWDIPDVPDFTDERWQQSRSSADIVRLTLGGRGACMPAFRGTITYAEACSIARYLRTFSKVPAERAASENARPSPAAEVVPTPEVTRNPFSYFKQTARTMRQKASLRSGGQK